MQLLAVIAFWGMLIQTYRNYGLKPPAAFLALWGIGFVGTPMLGIDAALFTVYQALLVIFMIIFGKIRDTGL